jgi:hypothetical protein
MRLLGGPMILRSTMIAFLFFVAGCSAPHSPANFRSVTVTAPAVAPSKTYPARKDTIWVTKADIPPGVKYEVLEVLDVGGKWYGGSEKAYIMLAKRARKIGADAVIRVSTWHQPSAFSWAAPQGHGEAIKFLAPRSFDVTKLEGGYY